MGKMHLLQRSRGSMEAKMLSGNAFRSLRCMNTSTTIMTTPTIMMSMTTTTWRNLHQEADKGELREKRRNWLTRRKKADKLKKTRKTQGRLKDRGVEREMEGTGMVKA